MADVDVLVRVLEPHTRADVTQTFYRFRETMRSEDLSQFVAYMVAQGLLPAAAAPTIEAELRNSSNHDATVVERSDHKSSSATSPDVGSAVPQPRAHATNLRLLGVIGRGGMGVVYRGEQVELGREVAFKQLLDGSSETLRERFVREARITAQLDHPNIVPVHVLELTSSGEAVGYAMKLVEGKTLRTLLAEAAEAYLRGQPIDTEHSLPTRLEHFLKICDAMAFAHARGVLHRDLKPANFMIGKFGEVYVMDWGVAKHNAEEVAPVSRLPAPHAVSPDLTQMGEVVGSPSYMAPEQADGRNDEVGPCSDQYALGLILFEIITLRRAIDGATMEEAFTLASSGQKAAFEHVSKRERIPAELRAVVEKATRYLPADRYVSVQALADDVRRYIQGDAVLARRDNPFTKLFRWVNRHRRAAAVVLAGVLLLSVASVAFSLYRKTAAELAAQQRGERRTAFYSDVAAQARRIDAQFQRMEEALEGLSTAAEWALLGPEPSGESARYFLDKDFADPAKRPADFTDKTAYRWPVSVDYPVVGIAPGTNREAMVPTLRRVAPLRLHIQEMVAHARGAPAPSTREELRELLLQRKSPIDYAYVDTTDGIHFVYPGIDSLPPDYDVRTASFYKMSENQRGKRWGAPYVDSTTDELGDDLVLPCTEGLWSPDGRFLGVAGVEITVTKLVETGLVLPGHSPVRSSLLNGQGQKVVDSFDAGKRFKSSGKDEGIALPEFDLPGVVAAVRDEKQGLTAVMREGKQLLVAYVRLDVLGWYLVVEIDAASIDQ